jgi:Tfp pilus assembly protein PilO
MSIRIWIIASAAAVLALFAGGWFLGVQPQLAAAAAATSTATNVQTQNQATRMKLASLTRAAAKSDTMQVEDARLMKAVPDILKPNTFIRRVNEVAALDGVEVLAITPSNAVAYTAPAATSAGSGLVLAKTSPLITPGNVAVVPVTVSVSGGSDSVVQFMHDIQNDERAFSISTFQIGRDGGGSGVTASLSGSIYTLKR